MPMFRKRLILTLRIKERVKIAYLSRSLDWTRCQQMTDTSTHTSLI